MLEERRRRDGELSTHFHDVLERYPVMKGQLYEGIYDAVSVVNYAVRSGGNDASHLLGRFSNR